jgi:hypothetical protein
MIINGGMDIWQRGTSSFTGWTADRWFSDVPGIISRSTDVPSGTGLSYSLKHTGATSNAALRQGVELPGTGNQGVFLDGSQWTVSFWVKLSAGTRNIGMYLSFTTGSGGVARDIFLDTTTNTATTSWQKVSYTFAIPTGNSISSAVCVQVTPFIVGNGNAVDVFMTGIQLESGSIATAFKRNANSLEGELSACQRYYFRNTNAQYTVHGNGLGENSNQATFVINFPTTMRSAPSAIEYSQLAAFDGQTIIGSPSSVSINTANTSQSTGWVTFIKSGNINTYRPYYLINNNAPIGYLAFWAEIY